jgi:hypothetical protein
MHNPIWFVIAVTEFIVLLFVFGPKVATWVAKITKQTNKKEKKDAGLIGVVRNLRHEVRGIMGIGGDITVFEIFLQDGDVFRAAIDGHDHDVYDGCTIEFWPSCESIGNIINDDDTKSTWKEKIDWYALKKYRIDPDIPVDPETVATAGV